MNVTVEKQPQCRVSMRVEFSKEEVEATRAQILKTFREQAHVRGYRPGKAPLQVIQKRFEKEISEELEDRLVRRGCREGVEKESLEVIGVTKIDEKSHTQVGFSFIAQFQIAPEFALPPYEGIAVTVAPVSVTDADVNRQMDLLRERFAQFHDLSGRSLQMGDLAAIQFTATLDGRPLEEAVEGTGFFARGESEWLRLAPESFIPGFSGHLAGLSAGDTKTFDLLVGDDFQIEALRGKTLHYEVTIKSATERILPDWTDELASAVEEGLTVESLRQQCRVRLEEFGREQQKGEITTQILEYLDQNVDFELPDRVLAYETQRQVNQIVHQIHERGMSEEQITGQKDAIIQHASTQAEVNVKTAFILQQIAEKEGIKPTEEELAVYCVHLAEAAGISVKKYLRQLQKSDALEEITDRIVRSKTLTFLRQKAVVSERPPEPPAASESPETAPE